MDKQQLTGYEAEVWSRDKSLNKETFVAAGSLIECKTYMQLLAGKESADFCFFILSGENQIEWNSLSEEWSILSDSYNTLQYSEKTVEAFAEAKRICNDKNIKGYTSMSELKKELEK